MYTVKSRIMVKFSNRKTYIQYYEPDCPFTIVETVYKTKKKKNLTKDLYVNILLVLMPVFIWLQINMRRINYLTKKPIDFPFLFFNT